MAAQGSAGGGLAIGRRTSRVAHLELTTDSDFGVVLLAGAALAVAPSRRERISDVTLTWRAIDCVALRKVARRAERETAIAAP